MHFARFIPLISDLDKGAGALEKLSENPLPEPNLIRSDSCPKAAWPTRQRKVPDYEGYREGFTIW